MNNPLSRLFGVSLLALALGACSPQAPSESARTAADDTLAEHAIKHADPRYRCPMHPDVVRDAPGNCPICGMTLVPIEEPAATAADDGGLSLSPAVINKLGVRSEPVLVGSLGQSAEAVGYVAFDERTVQQVRTRAEGWVEGLAVRAMGDRVEQGQLLFTLYSPMLEAAQQEYLDALQIGNRELIDASSDRLRALGLDAGTASRLAKSGRAAGRVAFHAPVAGVVTELEAREGAMLSPDMPAMTITQIGNLWIIAEVPEAQSGWIRQGTPAVVRFAALPGESFPGVVDYIYPELNMETRTLRARITLERTPPGLKPNMLARIDLQAAPGEAVLNIPRSALIRGGAQDRVVVALGEGRFASRTVVAGTESGDRIEIRSGLQQGEQVVVAAQFLLDSEANLGAGLDRLEGGAAPSSGPAASADPHAAHRGQ
jgi:Cu(I)/Ag(I) efflux system membrane fusion protein